MCLNPAIYWYADNIKGVSWILLNTLGYKCIFPSENEEPFKNLKGLNLC